jgi:hypothetical protein
MKKNTLITTSITIATAAIICTVSGFTYIGRQYIDTEGAGLSGYRGAELYEIKANSVYSVEQQIITSQSRLAKISIPIESPQPGSVHVALKNDAKQAVIGEATLPIPSGQVAAPVIWTFSPLSDPAGKKYWLEISGQTGTEPIKFLAIDPARYDGGDLYINGQQQKDRRIIVDWQYFTPNAWSTLIDRLTYAKPGIWGSRGVLISLIVLLFSSALAVTAWLAYAILSDDEDAGSKK